MILGDLLTELRQGVLHDFSSQIGGTQSDQLWSDSRLVMYIDQAQRRMARRSGCLRDAVTPQCTQFVTNLSDDNLGHWEISLDPSVLAVLSLRMVGDTTDLPRAGHAQFDTYRPVDSYYFDPSSLSAIPPGKPLAFSTDEGMVIDDDGSLSRINLRLYPAPSADYAGIVGQMRVVRMPLNRLTVANLNAHLEIPESMQIDMLDWSAYLALRIVDVDAGMVERAADFANRFEVHCKEARDELMKKAFVPAAWGLGRNGFTWERNEGM